MLNLSCFVFFVHVQINFFFLSNKLKFTRIHALKRSNLLFRLKIVSSRCKKKALSPEIYKRQKFFIHVPTTTVNFIQNKKLPDNLQNNSISMTQLKIIDNVHCTVTIKLVLLFNPLIDSQECQLSFKKNKKGKFFKKT